MKINNSVGCCWEFVLVVALGMMSPIPSPGTCSPLFPVPSSPGDPRFLFSFPVPSCPVPCTLSLCQLLAWGAAPGEEVQEWPGKEEGYFQKSL